MGKEANCFKTKFLTYSDENVQKVEKLVSLARKVS